jgi:hypothetical protein
MCESHGSQPFWRPPSSWPLILSNVQTHLRVLSLTTDIDSGPVAAPDDTFSNHPQLAHVPLLPLLNRGGKVTIVYCQSLCLHVGLQASIDLSLSLFLVSPPEIDRFPRSSFLTHHGPATTEGAVYAARSDGYSYCRIKQIIVVVVDTATGAGGRSRGCR